MLRPFPRSNRRPLTALVAAGSVLLGLAVAPLATAEERSNDELKQKKQKVERDLTGANKDLQHSSDQARAAAAALAASQNQLATAQAKLAQTRGELAAAQAFDQQMQRRLEVAVQRLKQARADLTSGHRDVADQEEALGEIVVANYQSGDPDLMGLSIMLQSQNPAELTGALNSVQSVIDKEAVTLSRLEASRILLSVQEEEVDAARKQVAQRRQAAAANLERKERLEQQAADTEVQVANLVELRETARQKAEVARRADLATLKSLEAERDRIAAVLARRAAIARKAAAAAAAAADVSAVPRTGSGFLTRPVNGYVTSPYGYRRHPIYGYRSLHDGIDYAASCGTPIYAPADGKVISTYFQSAWGKRMILDHGYQRGAGVATIFNHLSGYAVEQGDRVRRGQVIGYAGTTGWSTGCHLHFTVMANGQPVNPLAWL